jgi:hypothetical protein
MKGYFVLNYENIASLQGLFAQLWKEYSLSDSRYLTADPFMVAIETITVVSLELNRGRHRYLENKRLILSSSLSGARYPL